MSIEALSDIVEYAADMKHPRALAAAQELAAIERAARTIAENVKIPAIPAELEPALRLIEKIAKEAP